MTFISGIPEPSASLEIYSPIEALIIVKNTQNNTQIIYPENQESP